MQTRAELDQLFHPAPTLETTRLWLEPMHVGHAQGLFEVFSRPEVARFQPYEADTDVEATRRRIGGYLKTQEARSALTWTLLLKPERRPVGVCSLHSISWANRRGDLGFELAFPLWGQGLMREALGAVVRFGFGPLRFIKLTAQNTPGNAACEALLLSLSFEPEGLLRNHGFWKGQAHDVRSYGLLPEGGVL